MSSFISEALRSSQPMAELKTVSILEIQEEIGFTDLQFAHHNATGNDYLQLLCSDGRHLSIRVGTKANSIDTGTAVDRMRHLVNNNVIYTGKNDNGYWFTFGRKAEGRATVKVKFSDLMKEGGVLSGTEVAFGA